MQKKFFTKFIVSSALSMSILFATGLPVVDVASNTQDLAQNIQTALTWAKEAKRWIDTLDHYKNQITAYKDQLQTVTGVTDFLQSVQTANNMYQDLNSDMKRYQDMANNPSQNPQNYMSDTAKANLKTQTLYDQCNYSWQTDKEKQICRQNLASAVSKQASYNTILASINKNQGKLEKLQKELKQTTDEKRSQDIIGEIQATIVESQQIIAQAQTMLQLEEINRDIAKEQGRQLYQKALDNSSQNAGW